MKLKIFCTSIHPYTLLNKMPKYIQPMGLGDSKFPNNWFNEKSGNNISYLNKHYGELTGMYWVWKNLLENFKNEHFIGFCHYRKLWLNFFLDKKNRNSVNSIYNDLLSPENKILNHVDVIQVQPIIFKDKNLVQDFNSVHKNDLLIESLSFLNEPLKINFRKHLNKNILYPLNMFIVKKPLFEEYCNIIFPWLEKCLNYCKQNNLLTNYNIRLPAFLAERFTSFWFSQFKNRALLSYARLGNFFLSDNVNVLLNPLKIPFTSRIYPTIHKF